MGLNIQGVSIMVNIVVVDIDGTITDASERAQKYLSKEPKDWDGFYNACGQDKPIKEMVHLVEVLSDQYGIVFCTGHRRSTDAATRQWFRDHMKILRGYNHSIMGMPILYRNDGDERHDIEVKPELLNEYLRQHPDYRVAFILEDRNSMVQKWRELGFRCLQVADGDF